MQKVRASLKRPYLAFDHIHLCDLSTGTPSLGISHASSRSTTERSLPEKRLPPDGTERSRTLQRTSTERLYRLEDGEFDFVKARAEHGTKRAFELRDAHFDVPEP